MDEFKRKQMKYICVGGFKCPCCNEFRNSKGKSNVLNKMARQHMKKDTQNEIRDLDI